MNIKKLFFRDKQEIEVKVYECWEVRWQSRHGDFSCDLKPEIRVFPDEKSANEFKDALIDAFKLIRHTSRTKVTVVKQSIGS